jgi:hypothetical protein
MFQASGQGQFSDVPGAVFDATIQCALPVLMRNGAPANLDRHLNDMIWRHLPLKSLIVSLLVWFGLIGLFAGISMRIDYQRASEELSAAGQTIHRLISQRAAQHDAHLTSLVALIKAAPELPETAIGEVFQSILQFYPRIAAIDLVRLPANSSSQRPR